MSMTSLEDTCASLRSQIAATEASLAALKGDLAHAEQAATATLSADTAGNKGNGPTRWPLMPDEYRRYGRQMIVSQVGLQG
jgi:adenylyltransferase/sulfurtransferase